MIIGLDQELERNGRTNSDEIELKAQLSGLIYHFRFIGK